jgi:Domain of unknown function (DUF4432)
MKIELPPPTILNATPNLDQRAIGVPTSVRTAGGTFSLFNYQLSGGKRAGVELLVVDSGRVRAAICPTRGMGLWKANIDGVDCSWKSPIEGPVHPKFVPLSDPNGIGWLDGFDELLVRCGLQSFGAPDFAENGQLKYPLHGRIANQPAIDWLVHVDSEHSLLEVQGEVHEARFLQFNLRLFVKYRFAFGQPTIEVIDSVRNASDNPTTIQMLYHVNIGAPLLEEGASLHLAAKRIVARNQHAADDMSTWSSYRRPTANYSEQVYFSAPEADKDRWTTALLASKNRSRCFAVHYRTDTLPFFTQWKNTVGSSDGYVTGLEPGTGFPNPRSFEEKQNRVVPVPAGGTKEFHLRLEASSQPERVAQLIGNVEKLLGGATNPVAFDADWCLPRS